MAKSKNNNSSPIKNAIVSRKDGAYYSLTALNIAKFSNDALEEFRSFDLAKARTNYADLQTNVSSRPGLTRKDYDWYRPDEAIPTKYNTIIKRVEEVYNKFGIVTNIIDLMGDFVCQGIRLSHPRPVIEQFYRDWFKKVSGKDRSERFANILYRLGTVIIRAQTARVPLRNNRRFMRAAGAPDIEIKNPNKLPARELPMRFVFFHPTLVDVVGGEFSSFVVNPQYVLDVPKGFKSSIIKRENEKILSDLPNELKQAIENNVAIPLPQEKTFVYYYRKDDWQTKPLPMIYPILQSIGMLEKLYLADSAALDGAISKIRVWKLGSLEHKIAPTHAAVSKFSNILEAHTGAGTIDLIWDDAISLIESDTKVHEFLGEEKYKPHLNSIYAGLGIPPTLTSSGGQGATNNFISLKTLIRRLEYGRQKLTEFWETQTKIIAKQMNFQKPAKVEYKYIDLGDEASIRALLVQLADRNLISDELLQYEFDHDPDLEKIRIVRENKDRKQGKLVPKSGPYYDPQIEESLKKIALQRGFIDSEQAGVELKPGTENNVTPFEIQTDIQQRSRDKNNSDDAEEEGKNMQKGERGRPSGSKDKQKRKKREFKPKVKASLDLWVLNAQETISRVLKSHILKIFGKKNLRSLSTKQTEQAELLKFGVLFNIEPLSNIDERSIMASLNQSLDNSITAEYMDLCQSLQAEMGRELKFEECRRVQSLIYISEKTYG